MQAGKNYEEYSSMARDNRTLFDFLGYNIFNNMEHNIMKIKVSNCCSSIPWNDTDICAECKEHADFHHDFWKEEEEDG